MVDLSVLSKSYPFLSFARSNNLDYGDVLLLADHYGPYLTTINGDPAAARERVGSIADRQILHLTYAVLNGEIGQGEPPKTTS